MRCASAAARSGKKVVAAASVTMGGHRAGSCSWGLRSYRTSSGGRVRAVVVAPGLGFGLGLAAGWRRGAPTGSGGCLAAVLGFRRAAGAGFTGAWALAAAGLLAVGTGLGARLGGFPRGLGVRVLDDDVVVVADEVASVVGVGESEAEERAVGYGGGSWAAGAGVGCWVL